MFCQHDDCLPIRLINFDSCSFEFTESMERGMSAVPAYKFYITTCGVSVHGNYNRPIMFPTKQATVSLSVRH